MIKSLQSVSLLDILPENILADEQVNAAARALDEELQKVTADVWQVMFLPYLDVLPETVLDLLAWQWHVDFYEPVGMDLPTKRRMIRESIAWHRIKGTPGAVEKVINAVWDGCNVKEWFEYDGEPYHFRVINVTSERLDHDVINEVIRAIYSTKNVRSWLDGINFLRKLENTIYYGGVLGVHRRFVVRPRAPKDADVPATIYMGGAQGLHKRVQSRPRLVTYSEARATPYTGGAVNRHKRITVTQKEES